MPSFYDNQALCSFTTKGDKESFVKACFVWESNPIRRALYALVCLGAAWLCVSCVIRAGKAASFPLALLLLFVALLCAGVVVCILVIGLKGRRAFYENCFLKNAFLQEPMEVSLYKETIVVKTPCEQQTYYYSKMESCVETPEAFLLILGRDMRFLILQKADIGDWQTAQSLLSYAFGKSYRKRG